MKLPEPPPGYSTLLSEAAAATRLTRIFSAADDLAKRDVTYFHWDEIRRRKAPAGLTVREWWLALKTIRKGLSRPIPLKDHLGSPFQFLVWHSILERLHQVDRGLGAALPESDPIVNADNRDIYLVKGLMDEAITSSQLEGAVATRDVAKEMIRSGRAPRDRSERMILNNFLTMQRIRALKDSALTPAHVFELHRVVVQETMDDEQDAGRLRNRSVVVDDMYGTVCHTPPDHRELETRLEEMCRFANNETPDEFIHPVLRAITLHFWLAYDHPFVDGNGRLARALFYWSMLRSGYWLCEYISISQTIRKAPVQYYRAFLHTESDENDLTYFLIHQLNVLHESIAALHHYIDRQGQRMRALRARLRGLDTFNHRQRALLDHALRHPQARYTVEGHQVSHQVAYETARTDLLELVRRGMLLQSRQGRTLRFRSVAGLQERLASI